MSAGKVIVYGGKGALGASVLQHFKSLNYWVLNVDLSANEAADHNVIVNPADSWTQQEEHIVTETSSALSNAKVDGVFCVAGGWAGGSADSKDFIKNSDLMWKQSVWSSVIASRLASLYLREGGLLQLTGAAPAVAGTPGMLGYGMAKAAVHQLTKSLAEEKSGLPTGASVVALLPVTLDTPMNRKWMPNADHSSWTPLSFISESLQKWTSEVAARPKNGSLLKLTTSAGQTVVEQL